MQTYGRRVPTIGRNIFVASMSDDGERNWILNPKYYSDEFILKFTEQSPALVFKAEEGKLPSMHRAMAERILDFNHISWELHGSQRPYVVVSLEGFIGAVVVWPFRLTGPLPVQLADQCTCTEQCKVPYGSSYITYGGN